MYSLDKTLNFLVTTLVSTVVIYSDLRNYYDKFIAHKADVNRANVRVQLSFVLLFIARRFVVLEFPNRVSAK
jgi:hypothetical protein